MLTGRPRSLCSVFSESKQLSQHFTLSFMQKSKMKLETVKWELPNQRDQLPSKIYDAEFI